MKIKDRRWTIRLSIASATLAILSLLIASFWNTFSFWPGVVGVLVGLAVGVWAVVIPRASWPGIFHRHFGWFPTVIGVATLPYWLWWAHTTGENPEGSFFEISAQVLPVLLLAAIIDVRRSQNLRTSQLIYPFLIFIIGEIDALDAVAFASHANEINFAIVGASLATMIIALCFAVLADVGEKVQ